MISYGEITDYVILVTGFKSLEDVAAPIKWVPYPFEDLVDPSKVADKARIRLVTICVLSPKLLLRVIC